jgi:hypothetical protein
MIICEIFTAAKKGNSSLLYFGCTVLYPVVQHDGSSAEFNFIVQI